MDFATRNVTVRNLLVVSINMLQEIFFTQTLKKTFTFLQVGTFVSKAQNFAKITLLLHPYFIFNNQYVSVQDPLKLYGILYL